ncbi:hypothetical protein BGZ96_001577 [Linnemannia gamsii]|uniref:Transcription activator GCR1-like domain-containing protein n=1 Tax=Linnemannia gamsii TaxID=64522 RepID=A0ABQ7JM02_9FUNG|nr:hypothetical protein BGZ96_001577 [Linnemannia gamsii]
MEIRKILSRSSLTSHEDRCYQLQRSDRMKSLPDEDAGVVFWEDFCGLHGWPKMPTYANIHKYIEVFVNVEEEKINQRLGLSKGDEGYRSGHDLFTKPVLRLKAQLLNAQNAVAKPVIAAHVSPAPNKASNDNIHTDDTSQVSTCAINSNNKRPMPELDTDSDGFAEDSSRASLAVSAPSKSLRSSDGKLTPPPATMVSPLRQETIFQLPSHAHGKTDRVSHSYDASSSVGASLVAGEMGDKYPEFKAHEFNIGLSQTSDDIETYRLCRETNTVPQVLQEWRYGLNGHDAIQVLNNKFRAKWKSSEDKFVYETRLGIVKAYIRLVSEGHSDTVAIEFLEQERAGRSIATLHNQLKKVAPKTESSIYGKDEPEYPKHLIHQAGRVPRPPPVEETGFPLPVRLINSISNVWMEWEVGWKGAPSIRSQIVKHSRVWNNPDFKVYENHFRYRNQLVRTIHEAVRKNAVASHEDAIRALEDLRGAMEPSTFCKSKEFRSFLKDKWKVTTTVKEWWKCGQYHK